jgi:hypothetical protein
VDQKREKSIIRPAAKLNFTRFLLTFSLIKDTDNTVQEEKSNFTLATIQRVFSGKKQNEKTRKIMHIYNTTDNNI